MKKELSPEFNLNPNVSKKEVKNAVDRIRKYLKGKGINEWKEFHLSTTKFNRRYTEEELEKQFGIFFCNGLYHPIDKVELVYSSYAGLLSIVPLHDDPTKSHESYFNLDSGEDSFDNSNKNFDDIYQLWKKLIKL